MSEETTTAPACAASGAAGMRTAKGERIAEYIRSRRLEDGGRGYVVMGAYINARDGHAYESRCHVGCPKDCTAHVPRTIDHGQVTQPGPVERVERARERFYRFGF